MVTPRLHNVHLSLAGVRPPVREGTLTLRATRETVRVRCMPGGGCYGVAVATLGAIAGAAEPDWASVPAAGLEDDGVPPLSQLRDASMVWWSLAGVMLMLWSFKLVGWVSVYPALVPLVVVTTVWGLITVGSAWVTPSSRHRTARSRLIVTQRWVRWVRVGAVVLTIAGFVVWAVIQVYQAPGYGTDEMAFDQYAARLLAHGIDPYTRSMGPAFPLFHVQPDGYTYQLNGVPVTALSYPSLSFLVYVPFALLGMSTQLAVSVNVIAWAVATLVMLVVLPASMRAMALVVGSLSVYAGYAIGGVTVALYVPLLVGALYAWNRWYEFRGWRAWIAPVLMGLAVSINQLPWFVMPFVVVGIGCEASRVGGRRAGWRSAGRYVGIVALVAGIVNAPFVVWHPGAWLSGILTPITSAAVPAGQGLVELSLYLHLGGGSLLAYSVLSGLALLACLALYAGFYSRLGPLVGVLPAVPLLLATRSYDSYLFGLVPAALIGAITMIPASSSPRGARSGRRRRHVGSLRLAAGGLVLAAVASGAFAVTSGPPLDIRIASVTTTGQLATVSAITVSVHNRSSLALVPHFTLNDGDAITTFWLVNSGPAVLQSGQRATYQLLAPNFPAQPPINGGFQVVAFTKSPDTVSHSSSYLPTTEHLALNPDAINSNVPIGQAITVQAELLDQLDRPIHKAGVPVYLGQIVYAQSGLVYGEAIINGGQPGQTPVSALTNADGVATFTIVGTHVSTNPVYFEANLVNPASFYPYGYSQILPIRFSV